MWYDQPEHWSNVNMEVFQGQFLVLGPTIGIYVELRYIKKAKKYKQIEDMGHTLWTFMVLSNALKGFPSFTCG